MAAIENQSQNHMWGYAALTAGALALAMVFVAIFLSVLSPEPSPSVGSQIGQIAADIRAGAERALRGESQPLEGASNDDWVPILALAAPILGVVAIALSVISFLRGDPRLLPRSGLLLGVAAIVFQIVWWLTIVVVCVLLLVSIINNLEAILGG